MRRATTATATMAITRNITTSRRLWMGGRRLPGPVSRTRRIPGPAPPLEPPLPWEPPPGRALPLEPPPGRAPPLVRTERPEPPFRVGRRGLGEGPRRRRARGPPNLELAAGGRGRVPLCAQPVEARVVRGGHDVDGAPAGQRHGHRGSGSGRRGPGPGPGGPPLEVLDR